MGFFYNNTLIPNEMEKIILEIRASEGGEDSKLLVGDMLGIYIKTAKINNIN